jgi:hypothetical protein
MAPLLGKLVHQVLVIGLTLLTWLSCTCVIKSPFGFFPEGRSSLLWPLYSSFHPKNLIFLIISLTNLLIFKTQVPEPQVSYECAGRILSIKKSFSPTNKSWLI